MKRLWFTIFAIAGLLIVIGLVLSSCAVPSDVSTQPPTTSITPVAKQPATTPASSIKTEGDKKEGGKEDNNKTESTKAKREGIPDTPANHIGRTACIACHASGVSDIPKLPSDHSGRNDTTCVACHRQAGLQPTTAKVSADKKEGIQVLPPDHTGRTICTACHATGAGGSSKLPSDHSGRNDATCAACHKPSGPQTQPTTPVPVTTKTPAPAGKEDQEKGKKEGPPAIPANHQGRTTCTICHEAGLAGAPKNPPNHSGRNDAICAACHKQAG